MDSDEANAPSRWESIYFLIAQAIPLVAAAAAFAGGLVLLVSGAIPMTRSALAIRLPLPVIEASHFVGSVVGVLLVLLAQALRRKFPDAEILVCADNDTETPGNPGLTRAREAAAAVGGLIALAE